MVKLQVTTSQIHDVVSWNDATIQGILMAFILAFGFVIYHLFKTNQAMYKEFSAEREVLHRQHSAEIKEFNTLILNITNQYRDGIDKLYQLYKK